MHGIADRKTHTNETRMILAEIDRLDIIPSVSPRQFADI